MTDPLLPSPATDALGNPIVIGNWYGYSRSVSGWSHVTLGVASHTKADKVYIVVKKVTRYLYGDPTDYRSDEKPGNVSIRANMVFPVEPQEL